MTQLADITLSNRYILKKFVGKGGMGQVYQAWDRQLGSYVALKIINEARYIEAFIRDAVALKELAHHNIVRFYEFANDQNHQINFIVMDWIDGKDLERILLKRRRLSLIEVSHILKEITPALNFAHLKGIIHCDIKPSNILVRTVDKKVFLSDFGLVHTQNDHGVGGTLAYMAPELIKGESITVASDIYALGITIYQLLTGQLPFQGETVERLVEEHLEQSAPPIQSFVPTIPVEVSRIIEKALSKNPKERFKSVIELRNEILDYIQIINPGWSSLSLFEETVRPLSVFLCHSSYDKLQIKKIYERLIADNINVWLDGKNLVPGQEWDLEIAKAIRKSDIVVVCLSNHSINKAGYVHKEIKYALDVADEQPEGRIFLVPLKLEECVVPKRLQHLHWVDYFKEDGYEKLITALKYVMTEKS